MLLLNPGSFNKRNTPFTPAVHAYYKRYPALAEQVRGGRADLGVNPVIPPEQSSVVLRSYHLPIYAGQGDLSTMSFRISTMGAVTSADLNRLLKCFAQRA